MKVQPCGLVLCLAIALLAQACQSTPPALSRLQRDKIALDIQRQIGSAWQIEVTDGVSRGRLPPLDYPGWSFEGVNTDLLWYSEKLRTNSCASFFLYLHPRGRSPVPPVVFAGGHMLGYEFGQTTTHFVYGHALGPHPEVDTVEAALGRALHLLPTEKHTPWPTMTGE